MAQLIIGHVTTTTAKIWIRGLGGQGSGRVRLFQHDGTMHREIVLQLNAAAYFTAITEFKGLLPDTGYSCSVIFNDGKEVKGSFISMPEQAEEFSFLLGSCHFSWGMDYRSPEFKRMHAISRMEKSRFMLSCGDQMYIDTILKPFWVSSVDHYAERYTETWHSDELRLFFANLPQYMIWDDHEIYNDFVNEDLNECEQDWFNWAEQTYRIFQHSHNPENGNHLYYSFACAHAAFFVLDVRSERTGNRMISDEQMQGLVNWFSDETIADKIKFIVSPVPVLTQLKEQQQKDKWSGERYVWQRDLILNMLMKSKEKKVIILSGDIHFASHVYASYESDGKTYEVHELISSPIKQLGFNLLAKETPASIQVNQVPMKYHLGKHMGRPVDHGEAKRSLDDNVMSISVRKNSVYFKVYSLDGDEVVFEGEVLFG